MVPYCLACSTNAEELKSTLMTSLFVLFNSSALAEHLEIWPSRGLGQCQGYWCCPQLTNLHHPRSVRDLVVNNIIVNRDGGALPREYEVLVSVLSSTGL